MDSLQARDIGLSATAGQALKAAVEGLNGEASVRLSGFVQGTAGARVQIERITVETPMGGVRIAKGLAANASFENASGRPRLAGTLTVPEVVAQAAGFGATQPLPFGALLDAEGDLTTLELPRADLACQVPGLAGDELTLSLRGGPDYTFSAHNRAAGDLGALLHALPSLARGPIESLDAGGRVLAVTDLNGSLSLAPRLRAYGLLRHAVFASGMHVAVGLKPAAARADVKDLRATFRQEVAVAFDGALGGLSVTDLSGGLGSARVSAGAGAAGEVEGLDFGLMAGVALPTAARVDLAARASGAAAVEHPLVGRISLPFAGALHVAGTDLAGPRTASSLAADVSGSAGGLAPGVWLAVRAPALWTQPVTLRGGGAADVGRVLALVGALPAAARGPIESLSGTGAAGTDVQLDTCLGGGIAMTCVGAADVSGFSAEARGLAVGVGRLDKTFALDLTTDARFLPRAFAVQGAAHAEGISAPHGIALGVIEGTGALDWHSAAPSVVHAVAGMSLSGLAAHPALPPLSMRMAGDVIADAVAGDLFASGVELALGDFMTLSAPSLKLAGFGGDGISGTASAELPDLGKLVALAAGALPPALSAKLPSVSGKAAGEVELGGRLPLAESALASLMHGARPALPRFLPLATFLRDSAPGQREGARGRRGRHGPPGALPHRPGRRAGAAHGGHVRAGARRRPDGHPGGRPARGGLYPLPAAAEGLQRPGGR